MEEVVATALKIAGNDVTVLLQGESGTGKELIADFIHENSARGEKPFIKINCGAIPESLLESELFGYERGAFTGAGERGKPGLFELAGGGTLFLDEVGGLPSPLQVKLLRAIQEREIMRVGGTACIPVDIRIIAATNIDLREAADNGKFRSDLYYRLNVVPITVPPLRKRKADIEPLANRFLQECNLKYGKCKAIDDSGRRAMRKYPWPGNVRELENLVERLVVTSEPDVISGMQVAECFSDFGLEETFKDVQGGDLKSKVEAYERRLILSQMPYYSSAQALADALGINKSTLTRKMARYNIKRTPPPRP
jgi:transcriptional regulator with PAS, ATPase and Fis domain